MAGGSYALVFSLERPCRIAVGKLGIFDFPSGYYLYLGSAQGGLEARLSRHFREEKRLRWHIDYLLREARPLEAWIVELGGKLECVFREVAQGLPGAHLVAPGFGASDCRCPGHLVHFPAHPSFAAFRHRLGKGRLKRLNPILVSPEKVAPLPF